MGTSRKRFIVAENEITKRNEFKSRVFGFFSPEKKLAKAAARAASAGEAARRKIEFYHRAESLL